MDITKGKAGRGKSSYRLEIDGLRAVAVIAVIINHFNKDILPSGYLGVDVFFVISGFVITSSLSNRHSKSFSDFLIGFYTRRIKRLVPGLILFVVITSFLISLFNPNPEFSLKTGISSLFGLSNFYLLKASTDYFSESTLLNAFTHTWSLGVEEQFYFLFPLLAWFSGFSRSTGKGDKNLFRLICALSVTSFIAFVYFYQAHQSAVYFSMPTRLWEMGAGCLLFLGLKNADRVAYAIQKLPALLVIVAIIAAFFIPIQFAVPATISIVVLTALLIACVRSETAAYSLLTQKQMVNIGKISYSLYLWHWGILSISRWTIGIHYWSVPFQVALMLLLSVASYRCIENPLRHSKWSQLRWRSIGYGIGASITVASLLTAFVKIPAFSLYTGRNPDLIAEGVKSLTNNYSLTSDRSQWIGKKCVLSSNSQVGKKISIEHCTLGNFSESKRRVLVVGNSFSAAFTHAFDELVTLDDYSVTITSSWGAVPVREIPNTGPWDKASDYYWDSVVPSLIDRLEAGDWVFIMNDMARFSPKEKRSEVDLQLKQLDQGLRNLSDQLSQKNVHLAVLHGNPFAREANCTPAIAIRQWFNAFSNNCEFPSRSQSLARRENLNTVLTNLEAEGIINVVDLFDLYCPEEQCTYYAENDQLLYRDEYSHPSVEGARLSASTIRTVLNPDYRQKFRQAGL